MEKVIKSTSFYKNHNASYFCSATIENGKIISLYSEYGREGGQIWSPGQEWNGNLQSCLRGLLRDFGAKFYTAVVKAAYKEKLPSTVEMKNRIKARNIKFAKEKVAYAKKEYDKAIAKLRKAERG